MKNKPYNIIYQFQFDKQDKRNFKIAIDPKTLMMVAPTLNNNPPWTKLEFKQCERWLRRAGQKTRRFK